MKNLLNTGLFLSLSWAAGLLGAWLSLTPLSAQEGAPLKVVPAFPQLRFDRPLYLCHVPDGSNRLVVVEQGGRVFLFANTPSVKTPHLLIDLRDKVRTKGNEEGLLGLAFHPRFEKNPQVFLHYSASKPRRNVLSRFEMDLNNNQLRPETEKLILEVKQPYSNHNGGMIAFGPDGYLYVSLGDGGSGGDPHNLAQNRKSLLGKILRLDVDREEKGRAYAIPPDNPFIKAEDARPEIWAWGLRNVWRFSFDRKSGTLWAADVGQHKWEEVNIIKKGRNYGWNIREGKHRFQGRSGPGPYEEPVTEQPRNKAMSVTGGYVYRGQRLPQLEGAYVYGDFITGNIWGLWYEEGQVTQEKTLARGASISSFGEDQNGEIYFTSFDGKIYTFQGTGQP